MSAAPLSTNLPARYRYTYKTFLQYGQWKHEYTLVGAKGGVHLHISGPHKYDGQDHWSAGLEVHSRTPMNGEDKPPSHDECWLLRCPCWHDGTSLYAQEHFLPIVMMGDTDRVFFELVNFADSNLGESP